MITTEFCSTHTLTMGEVLKMITFHFYTEVSPAMYFSDYHRYQVHTFINFFLIYVPLYDNKMLLKRSTVVYFTHSLLFYMSVHFYFCGADVPILHLISAPFPSVWHRMSDDAAHIDYHTTEDFNKVFRVFVASYLHLDALHTQCRRKK